MSSESAGVTVPGDMGLFDAAEEFVKGRKAKDVQMELFVRVVQIGIVVANMLVHLGLDEQGLEPKLPPDQAGPGRESFPAGQAAGPVTPAGA